MVRFACAVVAVELLLTAAAGFYLSASMEPEPYAVRDDFRELGLELESLETVRRDRWDRLHSYDTNAKLADGTVVYVRLRMSTQPIDYELHLRREKDWAAKSERGATVLEEPLHGESGHTVRQSGGGTPRAEVVRFRGDRMLIVGFRGSGVSGPAASAAAARFERLARSLQAILSARLGWER